MAPRIVKKRQHWAQRYFAVPAARLLEVAGLLFLTELNNDLGGERIPYNRAAMHDPSRPAENITRLALLVEGGLAVVALIIGMAFQFSPLRTLSIAPDNWFDQVAAATWGVLATVPMLLIIVATDRWSFEPLERLKAVVDELIVPLFRNVTLAQMALISIAAGVGEEMLFRGLLQDGLATWIGRPHGAWVGLAVASIAFGLAHLITPTYALLAALVGLYLGCLFALTGSLLTPIVAHALYDFVALVYLVRKRRVEDRG